MDGARIISPGLKTGAGGGSAFSPLQLLPCSVPWEKGALPQRSVQVHGRKWPPSLRTEEGTDGRVLYSQLQGSQIVH